MIDCPGKNHHPSPWVIALVVGTFQAQNAGQALFLSSNANRQARGSKSFPQTEQKLQILTRLHLSRSSSARFNTETFEALLRA